MADPTPLLLLVVSLGGAALAGWAAPRRPLVAFGILFLLASLSRPTVETPLGTMRLEQPAIAVVGLVLLVTGRLRALVTLPRWARAMAGCLALYLAALAAASVLFAPDRAASLHVVAWWAVSLAGGVIAVVLVGGRGREAVLPLGLVGAITGLIGLAAAVLFLVAGPAIGPGVQDTGSVLPRVYGLAWEANLYASFLAACLPFGLELARSRTDRWLGITIAVIILLAVPLGSTRGAFIGLAIGLAVYLGTLAVRRERPLPLAGMAVAVVLATVVGSGLADVLLPDPLERLGPPVAASPSAAPGASPGGSAGGDTSTPPSPAPIPSVRPQTDTLAFRLRRVPVALEDLAASPILGLGAESFGQRHADPSQAGAPDHIAILGVAVLYESGLVGTVALAAAFVILAWALWRAGRTGPALGAAAAYLASIATMLAAYQATNALHFALNWLIVGAAVALAARPPDASPPAAAGGGPQSTPAGSGA